MDMPTQIRTWSHPCMDAASGTACQGPRAHSTGRSSSSLPHSGLSSRKPRPSSHHSFPLLSLARIGPCRRHARAGASAESAHAYAYTDVRGDFRGRGRTPDSCSGSKGFFSTATIAAPSLPSKDPSTAADLPAADASSTRSSLKPSSERRAPARGGRQSPSQRGHIRQAPARSGSHLPLHPPSRLLRSSASSPSRFSRFVRDSCTLETVMKSKNN